MPGKPARATRAKTPSAAERQRRKRQAQEAKPDEPQPEQQTKISIVAVTVGDDGALPAGAHAINGLMLMLDDDGTLALVPVGSVNDLMKGDLLAHAVKIHRAKFED